MSESVIDQPIPEPIVLDQKEQEETPASNSTQEEPAISDSAPIPTEEVVEKFVSVIPSAATVDIFNQAYMKTREELTPEELRALIACYGWLDNDERARLKITRADLTPSEKDGYARALLLDVYWKE